MKTDQVPIDRVIPYARNPRLNEAAVAKVAASIREFGFRQPIVVDDHNTIIAGHTRLLAAQRLGLATVPVHVAKGLTPAQVKAYRLADNRTHEESEWDQALLALELGDLKSLDYDLELTGFDEREITRALAPAFGGLTDPDEVPLIPETPVSKPGDVWLLGRHRLVCGDSTDRATVEAALNGHGPAGAGVVPHLMVTDPPYGVEYDASWRNNVVRANGTVVAARAIGKVQNDDRADWREAWELFPGEVAYVWHAGLFAGAVADGLQASGFKLRSQIIWRKSNFAIGRGDYHWQHEPCWYAVRGTGHWAGDRKQTTVWDIPKPAKSETGHSTQKPVECMKRPMENNSNPGQAVYEPFCGSGTTIIAAEMTGRVCHAVELNPAYVDVAVLRWQAFAGQEATHARTGRPFGHGDAPAGAGPAGAGAPPVTEEDHGTKPAKRARDAVGAGEGRVRRGRRAA